MLLFKKKYLAAIREGTKTQTIRVWKHRVMRVGQRSYIPGIGFIRINEVDEVALAALTDADAVPDGFPTAELLRREIESLYRDKLNEGHQVFRVQFVVLPPEEQEQIRREKAAE